jgi:hypothetical protein
MHYRERERERDDLDDMQAAVELAGVGQQLADAKMQLEHLREEEKAVQGASTTGLRISVGVAVLTPLRR